MPRALAAAVLLGLAVPALAACPPDGPSRDARLFALVSPQFPAAAGPSLSQGDCRQQVDAGGLTYSCSTWKAPLRLSADALRRSDFALFETAEGWRVIDVVSFKHLSISPACLIPEERDMSAEDKLSYMTVFRGDLDAVVRGLLYKAQARRAQQTFDAIAAQLAGW